MSKTLAPQTNHKLSASPKSLVTRVIYGDPRFYTKNPDFCLLPDNRILCVFLEADQHVPFEFCRIVLLESADNGESWGKRNVIAGATPLDNWGAGASIEREPWLTPRISRLRDGRLVILCDKDDYSHAHESQAPGIFAWWSSDDGASWSEPVNTGIPGIEPDQVVELQDGTLLAGTHFLVGTTQKLGQFVAISRDGGTTWPQVVPIASDEIHNFCEGAIVPLASGRLVCVIRENNHNNYPCYLSFSDDQGASWSKAVEAPFSGDRPYGGVLSNGRFLVTFANQAGRPTTVAWVGDIEAESGYKVSAGDRNRGRATQLISTPILDHPINIPSCSLRRNLHLIELTDDALTLTNKVETPIRYYLMPPDRAWTDVDFEAEIGLDDTGSDAPQFVVQIARVGIYLEVGSGWVRLAAGAGGHSRMSRKSIDMTGIHTVRVVHQHGLDDVFVDGTSIVRKTVVRETLWDRSWFGTAGSASGDVRIHRVRYETRDRERELRWEWDATSSSYPNQYEIDRWIELEENTEPFPDHGYTTWVELADRTVLVGNTTSLGMPFHKAAMHSYAFDIADLPAFGSGSPDDANGWPR